MAYEVLFYFNDWLVKSLKEIGELLQEKRKENGVSIAEAAEDLGIDESALENMEEGNTRAFKDMYTLKELVKDYAKYLGMDVNDVIDEFNDFLFEHTSKISLDVIQEAKAKLQENQETAEKKIISPYTKIPKPKKNHKKIIKPILVALLIFLFLMIIIYFLLQKEERRSIELKCWYGEETYEFTE